MNEEEAPCEAGRWLREAIARDILRLAHVTPPTVGRARLTAPARPPQGESFPVVTTVRCVNTETCGHRFEVGYLPKALPGCGRCGGRTVLVKVVKDSGPADALGGAVHG